MEHEEVIAMVKEMGLPFAYDHFAEGESPNPPFICFLYPNSHNFSADDLVYHKANALHLELYTDLKEPKTEEQVETVLDTHGIYYDKSEVWIDSENLYEILYRMEV